jgi:hypothetical protein
VARAGVAAAVNENLTAREFPERNSRAAAFSKTQSLTIAVKK